MGCCVGCQRSTAITVSCSKGVTRNFWPLGVLLNGTLVGLITRVLIGWGIATYMGRRSREQAVLDSLRKIV